MDKEFGIKDGTRLLIVLLAIAFTAFLFPQTQYFNYEYNKAQKWRYEELVAPFDFPLLKSETQIEKEKANISESFIPLYEETPGSITQVKALIGDSIPNAIDLQNFVDRKFELGIFDPAELSKYPSDRISVYKDGKAQVVRKPLVYTTSKFLNELGNSLTQEKLIEIDEVLFPNYELNESANKQAQEEQIAAISKTKGFVKRREVIITKGATVTEDLSAKLDSYRSAYQNQSSDSKSKWHVLAGYLLLTCLIYLVLLLYLKSHHPSIYANNRKLAFIIIWPVIFGFLVYMVEGNTSLSTYLIPFCIVPIIVNNFYGSRLALFVHIVVILIASFLSRLGYEFTFLQILAGIVTVLVVTETRYWNEFFKTIGFILLTYFLGYLGLELVKEGSFSEIGWDIFGWLLINGVLLLLAYPFIPIIEKVFGFVSSITLVELADFNNPLLKDLSIKAPGTFQHSLQVANLSEAAAEEIGGDSLLIKVAALYHDIGKMSKPEFFIENQSTGETPHANLNNFESAAVIIDHVSEGVRMAKAGGLPQKLISFITTHHGTTRTEYFYRNQKNEEPNREFDETLFRYPGPRPSTKEESILMMADSIEAASKSLKSPTGQDIDNLVEAIVKNKIESDQLSNSDLSFQELLKCKKIFKKLLRSIYHVRIEYPTAEN